MTDNRVTRCETPEKNESIYVVIVELIAELADTDPESVPALAQSIDPEALDLIFNPDSSTAYPELAFSHWGYHIYVNRDRNVVVQRLE